MSVNFSAQVLTFINAFLLGAGLSLLYDIFRIIRLVTRPKSLTIFIQDIIFAFLAALFTFLLLLLRCKGELRGYPLLGELCGFIACRFTLSAWIYRISEKLAAMCRRALRWIKRRILRPVFRKIRRFFEFLGKKTSQLLKTLRKFRLKIKKGLKHRAKLVYNQTVRSKSQPSPREDHKKAAKSRKKRRKSAGKPQT